MTPTRFAFINANNAFLFARTGFATDLSSDFIDVPDTDRLSIGTEGRAIYVCGGDEVRIVLEGGKNEYLRGVVYELGLIIRDKDTSRSAVDYMLTVAERGFKLLDAARAGF